jgi:hypothetical protein
LVQPIASATPTASAKVASRSLFELFSPDEESFANALLWKNLLLRTCTVRLWDGTRAGRPVTVWGGPAPA